MKRRAPQILNPSGFRLDGRRAGGIRPISVSTESHGGAEVNIGRTKIIAQVIGPEDVSYVQSGYQFERIGGVGRRQGTVSVDVTRAAVASAGRALNARSRQMNDVASMVQATCQSLICLDKYAGTHIAITIRILCDDGAVATAAINAAVIALVNANIHIKELAISVNAALIGDKVILDLTREETNALNEVSVCIGQSSGNVYTMSFFTRLVEGDVERLMDAARGGASRVGEVVRSSLLRNYSTEYKIRKLLTVSVPSN